MFQNYLDFKKFRKIANENIKIHEICVLCIVITYVRLGPGLATKCWNDCFIYHAYVYFACRRLSLRFKETTISSNCHSRKSQYWARSQSYKYEIYIILFHSSNILIPLLSSPSIFHPCIFIPPLPIGLDVLAFIRYIHIDRNIRNIYISRLGF